MKAKLFTLLSVVVLNIGEQYAYKIQIGDLYYVLNEIAQTAEVTSQGSGYPFWSTNITEADIPASVTDEEVTYSVTSIGYSAFYYCSSLASVRIPNSVTSIGNRAFGNCSSLTSISIPSSVTSIGYSAFENCSGLTSIDLPNSITSIGDLAFEYCSSLTSVNIPDSITRIEYAVFKNCTGLTSIEIPSGVTSIEERAFYSCTGLTSVTISNSVTSIGKTAFAYCRGMKSLTCRAENAPTLGYYAFEGVDKSIPVYVPSGSVAAYQAANQWNEFTNIRAIIEEEETIVACGDEYTWHDMLLTESGDYTDYSNDSTIAVLHLTFIQPEHVADSLTINYDDTLTWHGKTLLESGTYSDTIPSITGCDSIIYYLNLTVLPYVPPTVTIFGEEVVITDPEDSTIIVSEVDILGDSTLIYTPADNTLTLSDVLMEAGDSVTAAISYTGSDPLTIVLCDSSTIVADTVISSKSDIIITGGGLLVAEGVVPIIGAETASITFDSVSMYVRSLSSPKAVRQRIRRVKCSEKTASPALSGFATVDFNKTAVTPPEAEYGEVKTEESSMLEENTNALFVRNSDGTKTVLTEFVLTAVADKINDAVENISEEGNRAVSKCLINGQLYILLPDGTRYTATGLKME